MTVGFDPNVLISWYQAKAGLQMASLGPSATAGAGGSGASAASIPDAPWSSGQTPPTQNSLVTAALTGAKFVDPSAAKVDVANANADYKKLFAVYSGLQMLQALATAANDPTTNSFQLPAIKSAFQRGMTELQGYLGATTFDEFRLSMGTVTSSETSSTALQKPPLTPPLDPNTNSDSYTTAPLVADSDARAVAAFNGAVAFTATVQKPSGRAVTVNFDLADLGAAPRTMNSVAAYMTAQFKAAGLSTEVSVTSSQTKAQTITVNGKTVTIAPSQSQYAFEVSGLADGSVTFSAPTTQAAVYVAQTAGNPALPAPPSSSKTTGVATTTDDTQQQLLKLEAGDGSDAARRPGETNYATGEVFNEQLPTGVGKVTATATGADGSVYMLADATGTVNGQPIKGSQDAVLLKYDSAGALVYTRTLGAASSASGLSLAVSTSGQVAIAGSVTGDLDVGDAGTNGAASDSFVTLYGANGDELWSQRQGATGADQATAVAFDASGNVYVAGTTQGSIGGGTSAGGQDGYIRAYDASGTVLSTQQFGSSGDDSVGGLVIDGTTAYVAGQDGTNGMVRSFDITTPKQMTLTASRSLGSLGGGSVEAIGLDGAGNLLIGGATGANLTVGNTTAARGGLMDGFGAQISEDLSSTASDAVAYYGGAGSDRVTAATIAAGQVWLAGSTQTALPGGLNPIGTQDGFVAGLNVGAGAVTYAQRFTSTDQMAVPESIAVASAGGSVLDRLGLPTGAISSDTSTLITSATSARAGDSFKIQAGSMPAKTVTIEATDTVTTLTQKIRDAGFFNINVQQLATANGGVKLELTPESTHDTFNLIAGPAGHDALAALGLQAGLVRATTTSSTKGVRPADGGTQTYGLRLPANIDLNSAADIKTALTDLGNAITTTQAIYADLKTAAQPASQQATASGTVPDYITNQISNYQAALDRLTGGSSASGTSTSTPTSLDSSLVSLIT